MLHRNNLPTAVPHPQKGQCGALIGLHQPRCHVGHAGGSVGQIASEADYPFRMMWFTPLLGGGMVVLVSIVAAAISARPVLKLEPAVVFAGR
jgi:putative ABC transport system permease protein